jgi:putative ABC transport system permease protein
VISIALVGILNECNANTLINQMRFMDVFRLSLITLGRNKMRTMLTMLGIMIGIAAVICTVAIGSGGSDLIAAQLDNLGDNMVWVEAGGRNVQGVRTGNGTTKSLVPEDAAAILQFVPQIRSVSPNADGHVQVIYGNKNWSTQFRGESPEYLTIRKWKLASGSVFTSKDVESLSNVCVIGQTIVDRLFEAEDPIGKTIRVSTLPCLVVGTLASKGLSATGQDQDDFVLMPYTTAMHKLAGVSWVDDIYCSATSTDDIDVATKQIGLLLRQRHHLRSDAPDDFNIRHPEDLLNARKQAAETFGIMLAATASVALIIGGIGIMNIMLVSVTERTREIGVRMAVGATERDVRGQFLIEALVLSLLGGCCGIVLGIFSAAGISALLKWTTSVSPVAIVVAALFSAAVGIFFGYYPATKAASLDPIEALRFE